MRALRAGLLGLLVSGLASAAPRRECALGFLAWCVVEVDVAASPPGRFRVELFGGYKPDYGAFAAARRAHEAAGGAMRLDGPYLMLDVFVPVHGRPLGDNAFDLGLSYATVGVTRFSTGALSYSLVRASLRRSSLFGLIRSRYLVSSFGVGAAFPMAEGAGRAFPGGDGPRFTLGGKVGVQLPLTGRFSLGVGTAYGVVWYGPRFVDVAFVGGVGVFASWWQ